MPDSLKSFQLPAKGHGSNADKWLFAPRRTAEDLQPWRTVETSARGKSRGGGGHRTSGRRQTRRPLNERYPKKIAGLDGHAVEPEVEWLDEPRIKRQPPPMYTALPEELDHRHARWWEDRLRIISAMKKAGLSATRIERFENCGARAWVEVNAATENIRLRAQYCHDRHCLPCGQARGLTAADSITRNMETNGYYLHVVLTTLHRRVGLRHQISMLIRHFKRLRETEWWKANVPGGVAFEQMHPSETDGLWHLHLHAIIQCRFLPTEELRDEWRQISGASNVHVSAIAHGQDADTQRKAVAREVARYVARAASGEHPMTEDQLIELITATKGRRLIIPFGNFASWKITAKPEPTDNGVWIPIAPLAQLIQRAATGEQFAARILAALRKETPSTGPPHLHYHPSPPESMPPTYWADDNRP